MKQPNIFFKAIIFIASVCAASLISCEDELEVENEQEKSLIATPTITTCNFQPYSAYVDNGISRTQTNNMFHFSSFESYHNLIEQLELEKEIHEDSFVNLYSFVDDEDLDAIEELTGFDENLTLKNFENQHSFSSLRSKLEIEEENWLDTSDQRNFNWDDDPTINAFVEGVEASLYNEYNEIVICNTVYKWMDSGLLKVNLADPQAATALRMANTGSTVSQISEVLGSSARVNSGVEVDLFTSQVRRSSTCLFKVNRHFNFINGNHRIRARHSLKLSSRSSDILEIKAVTHSYKRRNGKWKKHRAAITAGIKGRLFTNCAVPRVYVNGARSVKKRRRRSFTREYRMDDYEVNSTKYNSLFSVHKQHSKVHQQYYR